MDVSFQKSHLKFVRNFVLLPPLTPGLPLIKRDDSNGVIDGPEATVNQLHLLRFILHVSFSPTACPEYTRFFL